MNKNKKAFSLIEILVVIAIVAIFSSIVIASQSSNKEMEVSMEKEKILIDLAHLKKESLLLNNSSSIGSITLANDAKGYQTTYAGTEKGFLTLTSVAKKPNTPEYDFTLTTTSPNALLHLYASNSKKQEKDITNANFASTGTGTFMLSANETTKLDTITTFYIQNPNNREERSNNVIYRFFSDKNLNESELDDITLSLSTNNTPLDSVIITFDRFGTAIMKNSSGVAVNTPITVTLKDTQSNILYTLTLPDDM